MDGWMEVSAGQQEVCKCATALWNHTNPFEPHTATLCLLAAAMERKSTYGWSEAISSLRLRSYSEKLYSYITQFITLSSVWCDLGLKESQCEKTKPVQWNLHYLHWLKCASPFWSLIKVASLKQWAVGDDGPHHHHSQTTLLCLELVCFFCRFSVGAVDCWGLLRVTSFKATTFYDWKEKAWTLPADWLAALWISASTQPPIILDHWKPKYII